MGALDAGITQILYRISTGDRSAADGLMPLVYDNLRRLANSLLVYEPRETTLQPTELVHEAYLKLVDQTRVNWRGRSHFFAVGAQAMRRILVDRARDRSAKKRGGSLVRVQLRDADELLVFHDDDLLALNEALANLEELDQRQARIVEMRFFGGLTGEEIGEVLGVSRKTVQTEWRIARAWLRNGLSKP